MNKVILSPQKLFNIIKEHFLEQYREELVSLQWQVEDNKVFNGVVIIIKSA